MGEENFLVFKQKLFEVFSITLGILTSVYVVFHGNWYKLKPRVDLKEKIYSSFTVID